MAKNFKLNMPGLNELMKSAEMQSILHQAGEVVASSAGEGFEHETHVAQWTALEHIYPTTFSSMKRSYDQNALLKALGSVGLKQ